MKIKRATMQELDTLYQPFKKEFLKILEKNTKYL